MDEQEALEVAQIARNYFLRETNGDEAKADQMLSSLVAMVQEPNIKLVHLEKVLFLIIVRGQGMVEVHTLAADIVPADMVDGFKKLAAYLQNIGVKVAYTYSDDPRFRRIARQTKLPIKELKETIDGKETLIYVMEF